MAVATAPVLRRQSLSAFGLSQDATRWWAATRHKAHQGNEQRKWLAMIFLSYITLKSLFAFLIRGPILK